MRCHNHFGKRQGMCSATHVLFHDPHAAGRFDIQSTAVERDALADDRDTGMPVISPVKLDQTWCMFPHRRFADGMNKRIAGLQRIPRCHGNIGLICFADPSGLGFERVGPHICRRPVDKVANQCGGRCLQGRARNAPRLFHQQHPHACDFGITQIFLIPVMAEHPANHGVARVYIG